MKKYILYSIFIFILICSVTYKCFSFGNKNASQDTTKYITLIAYKMQQDSTNLIEFSGDSINTAAFEYKDVISEIINSYGKTGKFNGKHVITYPYKISKNSIKIIKKYEGCRLTAYYFKDNKTGKVEKFKTIGYGHVIYNGDNTPDKITQAQAEKLLKDDLNKIYVPAANKLLTEINPKFKVTQGFFDGFVSLVYNCGPDGIRKSEFWQRLKKCRFDNNGNINSNDYEYMLAAVKTARISSAGHKIRRKAEYNLMRKDKV